MSNVINRKNTGKIKISKPRFDMRKMKNPYDFSVGDIISFEIHPPSLGPIQATRIGRIIEMGIGTPKKDKLFITINSF